MATKKQTDTITIRGVFLSDKNALIKKAKENRLSLNSLMLNIIDNSLGKVPKNGNDVKLTTNYGKQ